MQLTGHESDFGETQDTFARQAVYEPSVCVPQDHFAQSAGLGCAFGEPQDPFVRQAGCEPGIRVFRSYLAQSAGRAHLRR
eukprot:3879802-Alexandrium_andersonii.AAC.1